MASNTSEHDRRRYPRLKAPVQIRVEKMFGPRGRIFNISLGGVRVFSDELYKKGQNLKLKIYLPRDETLEAVARVAWIEERPPDFDCFYDLGIEFLSLPSNSSHKLQSVLSKSKTA